MPVEDWVTVFADMGDDPPNAVLVVETGDGETEIVVVELLSAEGDGAGGELTYEVQLLEDLAELDMELVEEPETELEAGQEYAAGHLFIDDVNVCTAGFPLPIGMYSLLC